MVTPHGGLKGENPSVKKGQITVDEGCIRMGRLADFIIIQFGA